MTIEKAKQQLLETLTDRDKSQMSLTDLKLYAETLSIVSNIETVPCYERIIEALKTTGASVAAPTYTGFSACERRDKYE